MNAHINFDLAQALVMVITDEEFDDPALIAKREEDHRAIDQVLAARVAAEDDELVSVSGPGSVLNRLLRPLNQRGSQRFLRESREKVWANAVTLSRARRRGPEAYAAVLAELEELSAAKVSALTAPGFVLLKLAVTGFGVRLPREPVSGVRREAPGSKQVATKRGFCNERLPRTAAGRMASPATGIQRGRLRPSDYPPRGAGERDAASASRSWCCSSWRGPW